MLTKSPYLFIASMNIDADHEQLFNEVYDQEHIPNLIKVPGVAEVTRYKTISFRLAIGGSVRLVEASVPKYHTLYGLERPEVLVSREWSEAVDRGRWPADVRPYTRDRRHMLLERSDR